MPLVISMPAWRVNPLVTFAPTNRSLPRTTSGAEVDCLFFSNRFWPLAPMKYGTGLRDNRVANSQHDEHQAEDRDVRYALLAAAALGLAGGLSSAEAGGPGQGWPPQIANQFQNPHPGFLIYNSYWHPGPYGFAGPTDCPGQPVRGQAPPPLMLRYVPCQQTREPHVWWRSPRDFFMYPNY